MSILQGVIDIVEDEFNHSELSQAISNTVKNPNRKPNKLKRDRFRVVVPISGGIDSTTLAQMAHWAGLPLELVHVKCGTAFQHHEIPRAERATRNIDQQIHLVTVPTVDWIEYRNKETLEWRGRNAVYIAAVADWMQKNNYWGEIWFGNHSGPGESEVCDCGDKGFDFFRIMNEELAFHKLRTRVVSPLIGMNKGDALRWCQRRGLLDIMRSTYSCYQGHRRGCGACWQCFGLFAAFLPFGVNRKQFPDGINFKDAVESFERCQSSTDMIYNANRMREYELAIEAIQKYGSKHQAEHWEVLSDNSSDTYNRK